MIWSVLFRIATRGCGSLRSCSVSVLCVFLRLATLNLRVDSCMFEMRLPTLAEGSRSGISFVFFLESLCRAVLVRR
jgi:hypothetical protein